MDAGLDPFGHDLVLDDVTLRTPGLEGHARLIRPSAADVRAEADWSGALEEALASEGVRPQILLELSETEEVDIDAPGTRSTAHGDDALEVEVPGPGEGWGQMVLHTDEAGVTTWEFARDARGGAWTRPGAAAPAHRSSGAGCRPPRPPPAVEESAAPWGASSWGSSSSSSWIR